jgi:hypothetical protein
MSIAARVVAPNFASAFDNAVTFPWPDAKSKLLIQ